MKNARDGSRSRQKKYSRLRYKEKSQLLAVSAIEHMTSVENEKSEKDKSFHYRKAGKLHF